MFNQEPDPDNGYTMIVRQTPEVELTTTSLGTTSAHAENTPGAHGRATHARNYLRMRGEYCAAALGEYAGMELPPRTRRIRKPPRRKTNQDGTTSAYAENTAPDGMGQ